MKDDKWWKRYFMHHYFKNVYWVLSDNENSYIVCVPVCPDGDYSDDSNDARESRFVTWGYILKNQDMSRVARKTGTGTQRQQIKRSRCEFVTRRQSVVALTCPQTYFLLDETAIVLATQRHGERSEVAVFWDIYQKLLTSTTPHFLQKVVASGFQVEQPLRNFEAKCCYWARAQLAGGIHVPSGSTSKIFFVFFRSAPVAFRRVALETPEWTSRDSKKPPPLRNDPQIPDQFALFRQKNSKPDKQRGRCPNTHKQQRFAKDILSRSLHRKQRVGTLWARADMFTFSFISSAMRCHLTLSQIFWDRKCKRRSYNVTSHVCASAREDLTT